MHVGELTSQIPKLTKVERQPKPSKVRNAHKMDHGAKPVGKKQPHGSITLKTFL